MEIPAVETREIDWLPTAEVLTARARAAAVVDLLLSPDPDLRQYFFRDNWKDGVALAEHDDRSGWHCYALVQGDTAVVKVCMVQGSLTADALARFEKNPPVPVPELALRFFRDPELRPSELSFLAWSVAGSPWQALFFRVEGQVSLDMGRAHLAVLEQGPKAYYVFAKSYHEATVDPTALKAVFAGSPLDAAMAETISPEVDWAKARRELAATGHPLG
jgi:hypothetical protein